MRILMIVAAHVLLLLNSISLAQNAPAGSNEPAWETLWSTNNLTFLNPLYNTDPETLCRSIIETPDPFNNYSPGYFLRLDEIIDSKGTEQYCVSKFDQPAAGVFPTEKFWKISLVCKSKATGAISGDSSVCAPPPRTCLLNVNNPVELPTLTKIETGLDWQSPLDPRFAIQRNYRSDMLLSARFNRFGAFPMHSFGRVWSFDFNDILYVSTVNPLDGADTSYWRVFNEADGRSTWFNNQTGQPINSETRYSLTTSGADYLLDNGEGVIKTLATNATADPVTREITWPDGYKITIDRTNNFVTKIYDNKGQIADFVYSNAVVPGASSSYYYVSEIVLSRTASGSSTPLETGRLFYKYGQIVGIGPNEPVLSEVDYRSAGQTVVIPVYRYRYASQVQVGRPHWPPLLTGISDGSVSGASQLVYYGEYTYRNYNHRAGQSFVGVGVASSIHAGGVESTIYSYSGDGKISVANALGRTTIYDYDYVSGDARLAATNGVATTNCLPTNSTATYSGAFQSTITERNGALTQLTRNARGYITQRVENSAGTSPRTTTYEWHPTRHLMTARQTTELRTEYTYDSAGLMTAMGMVDRIAASPTFNQRRDWTFTYTTLASGLKVLATVNGPGLAANGVNDVTTYTYTTQGLLDTVTDPNGLVTRILARNTRGLPTRVEMPDTRIWTFAYDGEDRLIASGFAAPGQTTTLSTTFTYNLSDQVTSYTNTRGKTWTFTYDAARRLTGSTAPTGERATFTLDALGNITRVAYSQGTAAATFWQDSTFDELGRVLTIVGAQGQTTRFQHDVEDNLATIRDPLNNLTTNAYDGLNRLISTLDRGGFTTGMQYNAADDMTRYTDPRSIQTNFTYNGFGEVIREVSADRGTTNITYNTRGLATSRTDARGITVNYAYDNGGRLTLIDYPAGTIGDRTFTYDQAFITTPANMNRGHVGRINDGTIRTDFSHQVVAAGPQTVATALYPLNRTYTVTERFDFEGNPTSTVYPSGKSLLYDIDDNNRISRIRLRVGTTTTTLVSSVNYRANGPISAMTYGDTAVQTRTYDTSYRLTGLRDVRGTTTLRNLTYGYNAQDNLTSITDLQLATNNETFTYTAREHLSGAAGPYGALSYTYDGVGNRITSRVGTATDTYTYPATSNRLSGINLATGGTRAYGYDAAGNVITDSRGAGYSYTYDAAGRMASMSINGVLQGTYKYDFAGRQAIRTISATAITIHSVFDSQGRRIAEYNQATGALIREYVWLNWEPIAVIEGGVTYLVRTDHIGRPVFATNTAGTKVWTATYDPFGGVRTTTGTPINARFPGQWFQSESGLHQNWMRDYDPTTGRYLQADPLGLVDGASVYGYAQQSPMMIVDPRGEFGVPGAVLGAVTNFGFQFFVNYYRYGNPWTALLCIDIKNVVLSAGLGALGSSPFALARSGAYGAAAGSLGINSFTKSVLTPTPTPLRLGDECDCQPLPNRNNPLLDLLSTLQG